MAEHRNNAVFAGSPANQPPARPDRNDSVMGKLNLKNGTPVGNENLCKRCTWGLVMTGYRDSDFLVVCTAINPNRYVPFTVMDCTWFTDKHKPTYSEMKKLAIDVDPVRVSAKTKGFYAVTKIHPARDDDEDEDEAARAD